MPGAQGMSLNDGRHPPARNSRENLIGLRPDDEYRSVRAQPLHKIENVHDYRALRQRMENLYPSRSHPLSETRGQNNT